MTFPAKARSSRPSSAPRGFTLLELLLVLAIVALATVAFRWSLSGSLRRAQREQAWQRWCDLDRQARDAARRLHLPLELAVDADAGTVSWLDPSPRSSKARHQAGLGHTLRIDQMRMPGNRLTHGTLRVKLSPVGQSENYALRINRPHGDKSTASWWVVLGASGQCVRTDSEAAVEQFLARRGS